MNKILEFIRKHSKITVVILIILCSLLPLIIVHILSVLQTYHKALQPKTTVTGKEAGQETSKKAKKKSNEMEL